MSLFLKSNQVCPFASNCPYNTSIDSFCKGAETNRETTFSCEFVNEQGIFVENKYRSKFDQTGKMRILQE